MINLDGDTYLEPIEVVQVLACLDRLSAHDLLYWTVHPDRPLVHFYVPTNDIFWWGSGDGEEVTPLDLTELERAYKDVGPHASAQSWAGLLYAARKRKLRPQGCAYPEVEALIRLFDACGPKRAIDIGNPYNHPHDGGDYAYQEPPPLPEVPTP